MPLLLQSLAIDPNKSTDDGDMRSVVLAMQKKMLYALSALTEANEKAQLLFLNNNGVGLVAKIIGAPDRPVGLQHKALQLALHYLLECEAAVDAIDLIALQLPDCASVYDPVLRPTIHLMNATWFDDPDLDNDFKAESMRKLSLLLRALQLATPRDEL
ncbi:hypothetical protein DYB32_008594 [Aphanomyces invadans]|uniref:Uncharacterized protein n=1 Tax=Aphanomyces invadans TaxID=157072 RepID=A0A3R6V5F3_9STRA|nr:hypothetical protein DYB32_008594 [Aphanomyces invadans]